jgi:hypothetical protein
MEAGVLLGGERVELAADLVERDRDVERRAFRGALEQQVLEEVRGASSRDPTPTQTPIDADRIPGMASVTTRSPPGSTVRRTSAPPSFAGRRVRVVPGFC